MSMVLTLFILIIFLFLVFSYLKYIRQCTTTASLLRDIWSGASNGCSIMRCTDQSYSVCSSPTSTTGTSVIPALMCVCGSCVCHHLENVLQRLRPASNLYSYLVFVITEIISNTLLAVAEVADGMSTCHSACQLPRQTQVTGTPYYTPGLVSKEYSDKDVKRIKSIDDRKAETTDVQTEAMRGRSDTDKRSDYEVVFDRPPPPPFDRPLATSGPVPLPKKVSAPESAKPPSPSNRIPSPDEDKLPETRSPGISAAPPQSDATSGQDKLSYYPFENKPREIFPTTSSVIAEAGSSKGKSTVSQPSSILEIKSCRKCLEKGRTCISDCPKAKVSKKTKK